MITTRRQGGDKPAKRIRPDRSAPRSRLRKESSNERETDLETNCRKIVQRLQHEGFVLVKTVGSHHKYKKQDRVVTVPYPHPSHDLALGTVHNIYVQAGWATHPVKKGKTCR